MPVRMELIKEGEQPGSFRDWSHLRLYQCPGCWAHHMLEVPDEAAGYMQCDCGEKLTIVDLRCR